MGKVVKAVVGVVATVVGAITGQLWLVSIGLSLVSSAVLTPSLGGEQERQASEIQLQIGEYPRQALFGRAATAGSLMDAFNYGGDDGTDWEVLIVSIADHECDALESFYVNDTQVNYTADGFVPGYNNQLQLYWLPGTATQSMPSIVTTHGENWTSNDNAAGVACVVVAYKADEPDSENPVWPGGRPRFLYVARGKKCYIPGKDSTVTGGSGSHRYADPSTWEWTDNAAECRYQFQRGIYALDRVDQPDQLLIGRGLTSVEAPPERAIAYAATCAEDVALADGGTEPRYRFNGLIGADEDFLQAESYFAAAMGGIIRQPEGGIEVEPGAPKVVSAEITDLDILNLEDVTVEYFRGEADKQWVNTVAPQYTEEEQRWTIHSAPIRRNVADLTEDGGQRLSSPTYKHVTSGTQAQRLGEIERRLGRLLGTSGIVLGPRFAALEEGDWIGWTSDRHFKGERKVFRLESYNRDEKWRTTLPMREINVSAYLWTPAGDEAFDTSEAINQLPPSALEAPDEAQWSLTGTTAAAANASVPALVVSGTVANQYAQFVRIEYRRLGDTEWIQHADLRRGFRETSITAVASAGEYQASIRYVIYGFLTPRLILGPVTVGVLTYGDGTPIETLKPAEPGATDGAVIPTPGSGGTGNVVDEGGNTYDPGELLNSELVLTPAGRLEYRPLPLLNPVVLGQIELPDLGAVSAAAMARAEEDIDKLATAVSVALDEASQTRETFTSAGFYADPVTGVVKISAIEQAQDQINTAEVRLSAAEASINLRATTSYVDEQIALAVIDPSQIADFTAILLRISTAEVDIDALEGTVSTLATTTELTALQGRVTTAESEIDALEGQITSKVETSTFNALDTRVTTAEATLSAIGDTAAITNAVTSVRLIEKGQDDNAETAWLALLEGDKVRREQIAAIADAREDLTTRIIDGDTAEATARLALQAQVDTNEADLATERTVRANEDESLANQITALSASTTTTTDTLAADLAAEVVDRIDAVNAETSARILAVNAEADAREDGLTQEQQDRIDGLNAERAQTILDIAAEAAARQAAVTTLQAEIASEQTARTSADSAIATSVTNLEASVTSADNTLQGNIDAEAADRQAAIDAEALQRTTQINDEANARIAAIQAEADARNEALSDEEQARIDAINAERAQTLIDIAAERTAREQAITTLTATVESNDQARVDADNALAASISTVQANLDSETTNRQAAVSAEEQARINGDDLIAAGVANQVSAGSATDAKVEDLSEDLLRSLLRGDSDRRESNSSIAAVREETTARITEGDEALATSIQALVVRVASNEASIISESEVRATETGALATSIDTLSSSTTATTAQLGADLSAETDARIAAVNAEEAARIAAIQSEAAQRIAAVDAEEAARIAAIQAEADARGTALTDEENARIAAIQAETDARTDAITDERNETLANVAAERTQTLADIAAETAAREADVATLTASISTEETARTTADTALSGQIITLNANLTAAIDAEEQARIDAINQEATARAADISAEANARATAVQAEADARIAAIQAEAANRIAAIQAEVDARETAITGEESARIAAIQAEADARSDAIADERTQTLADISAERTQTLADVAAEAAARTSAISTVDARITTEVAALVSADSAQASQISALTTAVDGNTASITTQGASINGLLTRYSLALDVNGYVTGVVFNNDGTTSDIVFVSDRVAFVAPGETTPTVLFDVSGGQVRIKGDLVVEKSIQSGGIADNAITRGNSSFTAGQLVIPNGVWTQVQSCDLSTDGGRVKIDFCGSFFRSNGTSSLVAVQYRFKRGATVIRTGTFVEIPGEQIINVTDSETFQVIGTANIPVTVAGSYSVFMVDDAPLAADHTYSIEIFSSIGGAISSREMALIEFKK